MGPGCSRFGEGEGIQLGYNMYDYSLHADEGINDLYGQWSGTGAMEEDSSSANDRGPS